MCIEAIGRRLHRGVTLIELIVFIVIVSVALVGVLSVLNLTAKSSADPIQPKQAMAVAEGMMDEILSKNFSTGGWSGAATPANRPNFDDVGDYGGYASTGVFDATGSAVAGLGSYNAAVTVAAPSAAVGGVAAANILLVTVNVTAPNGTTYSLPGYRFNY